MPWRYARWPQFSWPSGGAHKDRLADHLQGRPKKSASFCRIADNLRRIPCPQTSQKLLHNVYVRHLCFCSIGIPLILCSHEIILYVQYLELAGKTSLETSYSTDYEPLCFAYSYHNNVSYSHASRIFSVHHSSRSISCAHKWISYSMFSFVVRETIWLLKCLLHSA